MNPIRIVRSEQPPPLAQSLHVPVAIVGAGACGLSAAIRLRDAGIPCVLLERDASPSGSTALSSGFIPAAGTRLQKSLGIEDSNALFAQDVQAKAHGDAAPHLVSAYTEAVAQAIDALEASHGITFEVLDGFLYPGHRVRRMHAVPERTGAALMAALERAAQAAGADIVTEALVRELWVNAADQVLGLGYERPDGTLEYLSCDALLLACNGFGGNPDMVSELLPAMRHATFAGHTGNDGSAILWGRQLQAGLADLGGYQGHGSWATPQGALMSWAMMMEGGVQINAKGERFHDETQGYSEAAVHVLAQPGGVAWNILDTPLLAMARTFPDFVEAEKAGALRPAPDAGALAQLIGCTPDALNQTLAGVQTGQTDAFGRCFKRALNAPFYAVKVTGALFHTQGGLAIDAHCRVLKEDGTPLPNLLAAGGAARGVSGNAVWGYLSGNGLLSALGGGWVAAGTLAAQLQPAA
jgi:fumarate reductase flavoprotein subunit